MKHCQRNQKSIFGLILLYVFGSKIELLFQVLFLTKLYRCPGLAILKERERQRRITALQSGTLNDIGIS